jgi:hypothetical protein
MTNKTNEKNAAGFAVDFAVKENAESSRSEQTAGFLISHKQAGTLWQSR